MPKPTRNRADRFAEIARKTGGVFVFATRDATLPNRKSVSAVIAGHQFANCHCNKCTATFAFPKAAGSQPFCVVCSSGDVDVQEDVKPNIAPDEELSYLTCAGCGTINMFHNALASVGKHIHCSACGTDMLQTAEAANGDGDDTDPVLDYDADADDEDGDSEEVDADSDAPDVDDMELLDLEDDLPDADDGDDEEEDAGFENYSADKKAKYLLNHPGSKRHVKPKKAAPKKVKAADEGDDEDDEAEDGENTEEDATTTNEDTVGEKPNGKALPDDTGADRGPGAPDSALVDGKPVNPGIVPTTQNPGALEPKVTTADADEMPNNDYSGDSIDLNLVDLDEGDAPTESISFFYGAGKVMLSTKDQIIATLVEADAGDFKDMLQTEQFRMSVAHTIETEGLKAAIATYKFKPAKVTVRLSKVVSMKVEAALKAQRTSVQAGADTYADQFGHSLDIAAAGYAGNFWRNKHDPLKTALIAELNGLGIRKPGKIIDKVFAAYSVAQFREVLEVARELSKKPVEALNALAETIDLVKYTPTTTKNKQVAASGDEDQDDDTDGDDDNFGDAEDEFATATPVKDKTTASTEAHSQYKTPELRKILGGSEPFFS